jgi:hypothetical protein
VDQRYATIQKTVTGGEMPLNKKGLKIRAALEKQYGKKNGLQVFYAMENSGKIKGVKKK